MSYVQARNTFSSCTPQVDPFAALRAQRTQGAPQGMHFILSIDANYRSGRRVNIVPSMSRLAQLASLDDLERSNWHSSWPFLCHSVRIIYTDPVIVPNMALLLYTFLLVAILKWCLRIFLIVDHRLNLAATPSFFLKSSLGSLSGNL